MIQYLFTVLINLIIGGIAFSKRQLNGALALSLVSLCLASWIFELYLLTVITDERILSPLYHFFRIGMFFIPSTLALFTWRLVNKKTPLFVYSVIFPGFFSAFTMALLNNTVFPTSLDPIEAGFQPEIDAIYMAFIANFIYCMISSLVYSSYNFFRAKGREKEKIRWLIIAMGASFISGGISIYLFQFDTYLNKLAGPATNILFVSLLLYATIQHNLMDLRLALSFWATRLLLLSLICWMYFYLTFSLDLSVDTYGGTITLMLFFVLVLEMYPRMLNWIMPGSKRLFGAQGIDIDRLTAEMRLKFSKSINVNEILDGIDYLVDKVVRAKSYKFLLVDDRHEDILILKETNQVSDTYELNFKCLPNKNDKSKASFYLSDEVSGSLNKLMAQFNSDGCLVFSHNEKVLGILFVATPRNNSYFRYDDVLVLEWLAEELPQTLMRIFEIEKFESELVEAKKTLSLLQVMNHYHHDIKAPLSIIDGVLTHELYDKEQQRKIILEQVSLGSKLITTMASLLKDGRKRKVAQVSIDSIVNDCLLIFSHTLARIDTDLVEDAFVTGDADDLKILFINIIKNATEAAKANGKVSVKVKAWKDQEKVWISFADDGEGMAEEQISSLWATGQAESTKEGGSGVGLQAIKRIADEHNATINVSSRKGKGTDFTLSFPKSA